MLPIFTLPEPDHSDNLWTYYAILNSRLTRLHSDEAGSTHNNHQMTTYTEPALSAQEAL
jgi:hypothetical protein